MGQLDGGDVEFLKRTDFLELEDDLAEFITIRRYTSTTPASATGFKPVLNFTNEEAKAFLQDLGIGAESIANDAHVVGDIQLLMLEQLAESDSQVGGKNPGDRVIYRGAEYRLVQRQIPVFIGDILYYQSWLRRTNSNSDKVEPDA